nr:MAG TPA: hypothetical protein [Caudoviricetes sp.]
MLWNKYMEKTAKIAYKMLKYSLVGFSAYYLFWIAVGSYLLAQ